MVEAVRSGRSLRAVAEQFKVSVGTVVFWVERARGKRLDRVAFSDRKPGRAWNRTAAEMERRIVGIRGELRDKSVLGEYGADAIGLALQGESSVKQAPSRATIHRVLARTVRSMACIETAVRPRPKGGICLRWPVGKPSLIVLISSRT